MHRILRLICLFGAVVAPVVSAQTSRQLARMTLKGIEPIDDSVPEITKFFVVRVAQGEFPMVTLAAAFACVVAAVGLYAIFSPRISREAAGTLLLVICAISLGVALLLMASTSIAISIGRAPL